MRAERLFEIVFILLNRKQTTAQELAKKFGVSVRTIYRDMALTNIKLKCTAKNAYRLYDEFPPELIAKNSDGSYTLNAALPFDSWLYGFILSLGTEVEILEPENLKTEIAHLAEEIMKKHRKV